MANTDHDQMEVPLDVDLPVLHNTPRHNVPLQCRCMVHKLGCLLKMLSEEKKATMRYFGFGGLLEAASYSLRMTLVEDLVACLDPDTGILSVHGRGLHMTSEHAGSLLGLPTSGPDVDGRLGRDAVPEESFRIARSSLTPSALYTELIQLPNGEEFKRKLLLYIVGTIIRPTSNVHISTSYLSLMTMLDDIRTMNWAKHAFQGMLAAVRTYKNGRARGVASKCIGGCIWLLQLFYLEHLAVGIIHQPIVDRQPPCVSFWTEPLISRVVKHVKQRGGVGTHTVDMLSTLDGTPHRTGQENDSLRSKVTALQRELGFLRTHVALQLHDIRREMSDMIFGQLENIRNEAVAPVREELASVKSELANMRQMLHDYMSRGEDATKTGAGTSKDHRESEAQDVSQDHREVAANPVVLSSEDVNPTAVPIPETGVTQELHGLRRPRVSRSKKKQLAQGKATEEKHVRVIPLSFNSPLNHSLRQPEAVSRRDTLRSFTKRIPGAKKRSSNVGYSRKENGKQQKTGPASAEEQAVATEGAAPDQDMQYIHDVVADFVTHARDDLD